LRFLQRPVEFEPLEDKPGSLGAVVCELTTLVGDAEHQDAVGTGVKHKIPASLALVSIGYHGEPLPGTEQWFNSSKGVLQHQGSLVASPEDRLGGLFTAGWLKRGPSGIIGTNIPDAKETAASIVSVVEHQSPKESDDSLLTSLLHDRQVKVVTWEGYRRIAQKETEMKRHANQPREKIASVRDMLAAALAS
jgi:NADPH-dependent glutamate synthase beta subunit-like oxidoreductase